MPDRFWRRVRSRDGQPGTAESCPGNEPEPAHRRARFLDSGADCQPWRHAPAMYRVDGPYAGHEPGVAPRAETVAEAAARWRAASRFAGGHALGCRVR